MNANQLVNKPLFQFYLLLLIGYYADNNNMIASLIIAFSILYLNRYANRMELNNDFKLLSEFNRCYNV
jgi:hypothetical protein